MTRLQVVAEKSGVYSDFLVYLRVGIKINSAVMGKMIATTRSLIEI